MKPLFKFLAKTLAAFLAASFLVAAPTAVPTSASAEAIISQLGIDIDGEAAGDLSGSSVSLSSDGTRVAIGAYLNDGTGSNAGHVRVYELSGGSWTQLGSDIDGEAADDYSGFSVSLSSDGTRVAIGAFWNDGNGNNSGHVRVYELSGGSWTQLGSDIDGEAVNDQSGYSVSLSSDGTRVAIGAYLNDGTGMDAGHVRVYELSGGSWTQLGSDIDGEAAGDSFGRSVSLSSDGTRVAIGAYNNDGTGSNAGHVRIYEYSSDTWSQLGSDIDGEAADNSSGLSVSLSSDGTRVAIGAPYNGGNGYLSGHVRVYELIDGSWTQLGSDIDGEAAGDQSGYSVSLSSGGTRVAIGAPYNDGNGSSSGHVRIYEYSSDTWSQLGSDIDGEAEGDRAGRSVPLSSDGSRVANAAYLNDGNGVDSGHVRVYSIAMQAAPAPVAVYTGPLPTSYSDRTPAVGDEVTISGLRLSTITSCTIDGVSAVISNQSADSFTITIPDGITTGLKNLVISSSYGILTAQGAFTVTEAAKPAEVVVPTAKTNAGSFNGYIAVYAKGHKGKTLSWKIAGKWFKTAITSDYQVFQRKTAAIGLNVKVDLYIDGKKQLTKTVKTR